MGTCASLRRRTCVHACLSPYACIYLRVYMRRRVSALFARVGMCAYVRAYPLVCVDVCVHVYTRARVCASVRAKGKNHFF